MKKLWDSIMNQAAPLIGAGALAGSTLYSTERNINENRKSQAVRDEQVAEIKKLLDEQKSINQEQKEQVEELKELISKYQKLVKENNETLELPTKVANTDKLPNEEGINDLSISSTNVKKSSLFDLEFLNSNEILYPNEFANNSNLVSFSSSLLLASFAALSALMGLITNYYTKLYGDKYVDKAPKWVLPIINNYLKLVNHSNHYYFIIIFLSQVLIMLISIYMKFRGIA